MRMVNDEGKRHSHRETKIRAGEMQAICEAVSVPYYYFYNAVAIARDSA